MSLTVDKPTIQRFDVAGPRYTSYPTAPIWSDKMTEEVYIQKLRDFGLTDKTLSLYIHIPFCQSLCSFCGCNVVIRNQAEKFGDEYLEHLFKEIDLVAHYIGAKKQVKQFHWGGGTPTYLNEGQIERLFNKVRENFDIDLNSEVAIEIDPRTIDKSKVKKLKSLGFNRISMGVQDFNPQVQEAVNRIQSYELVKEFNDWCRELAFDSVNFDLIYGLPYQTQDTFAETVNKVIGLKPDRIALYSFAYVPWLKKHQNKMDESTLPTSDVKLDIFLQSRGQLLDGGYQAIAMDHFALKGDELSRAFDAGTLYRNFMGYTVKPADEYIGLGLTSIGHLQNSFIHNHKALPEYYRLLGMNKLPVERGMVLSRDDLIRQWAINALMCQFQLDKDVFEARFHEPFDGYFAQEQEHMRQCAEDGLIELMGRKIKVTELGRLFIRNVCMGFDAYLKSDNAPKRFSKTI